MTPAINLAKKAKIPFTIHQYSHDENHASFGLEAVEKLAVDAKRVFKTLVVMLDKKIMAVAIIPVAATLSMKHMAKHTHSKKAAMANADAVIRATGYILGGVSPLAQKKKLLTLIDTTAQNFTSIYVSAGKRGL
ncbi:MAG TPA: aminoacyl-tRNA deacylase, partial [Oceanospirillales bacterium]|nr:aminoacyl-tRNA deacylase [Oceanospirillales bacterium]